MRTRQTLIAAIAYLALSLALTYPLVLRLSTAIAGLPGNDSLEFVWSIWWFKHSLIDLHASPLAISVLNYPNGLYYPLLPTMSQPFLLALPLAALVSPIVAFNVVFLFSFPLCALAGYWLCFDLTGDRRAAFIGGLIWGFFPSKSAHALAGHLFQLVVFTLPIAALCLLRALRQPSRRSAVLAGAALALAATVHPVNVAYFLVPVIIVVVAGALWNARRTLLPWARTGLPHGSALHSPAATLETPPAPPLRTPVPLISSILITGLVGGLLSLPLFLPTLTSRDQLGFLVDRGVVGFSLDLLTFILPAPFHPLLDGSGLAGYIRQVNFFEFEHVGYLGIIPLTLSGAALRWRWRESRAWLALGLITLVLSLGPELHVGRQLVSLSVEGDQVPILLPYALLDQLPILQWSRTPGRLNETTVFAVMILSAYGAAALLPRMKNRTAAALWLAACLLIPVEYVVRWPLPTTPVPASTALADLARDNSFEAAMNFPVPDNAINLLGLVQQTFHGHPLVGGRVYRDQPGTLVIHDFLSRTIIAPAAGGDIARLPGPDERAAAFAGFGVGRILYQPAGDPDGSARAALDALFGPPRVSDSVLAIYSPATVHTPLSTPFFIFGSNWYPVEQWQAPTRWFKGIATVYLYTPAAASDALAFTAIPGQSLRRLLIKVNGAETARFGVGDWAEYRTPAIEFKAGLNVVEFFDEDGAWHFVGDPRCQGGSAVAGPFPFAVPCAAAAQDGRDLSLAIQDLRLVSGGQGLLPLTTFGEALDLLAVEAQPSAGSGESLAVHFTWRAARPASADYTMFVHLLNADGQLAAGNDSPPARGAFPTGRWQAGQVVEYNVRLTLPADLRAGLYQLEVGWYAWPSLELLTDSTGAASFTLGSLTVRP